MLQGKRTSFRIFHKNLRGGGGGSRGAFSRGSRVVPALRTLDRCNRTRARPGPQHDHTIWSCCGPEFLGPQHNHTIWSCYGPEISGLQHDVGKYYGRALVLRHRGSGLVRRASSRCRARRRSHSVATPDPCAQWGRWSVSSLRALFTR